MTSTTDTNTDTDSGRIIEVARQAAAAEARAVGQVSGEIDDSLVDVLRLIRSRDGKVLVTGAGTSGTVARRMAHLLSVSGTPSLFIHPMDALHGTMGAIEPDDVLIALSKGGESDEINQLCALAGRKGTAIVGIGERPQSTFAGVCDIYVCLHTADGGDPRNVLAMGSTLVAAAWGDALTRALMHVNSWTLSESLEIHPAGAVGKSARHLPTTGAPTDGNAS